MSTEGNGSTGISKSEQPLSSSVDALRRDMTPEQQAEQVEILRTKLNLETAEIAWQELQRHYAGGKVIVVSAELDLVDVAYQVSVNNAQQVDAWMQTGLLAPANDEQALTWFEQQALLWAVVVAPWVLVQDRNTQ